MCGFVGYVDKNKPVSEAVLKKMQASIIHRGPDDSGRWISQKHGIGLAHQRLSIIDMSSAGRQPMFDGDNRVAICFNGEIYNHLALRKELIESGYKYFSNTDTETILYAYQKWGINFIDRLEGMFSIVIYDLILGELYLIRDRMGIKPLYFSWVENKLGFASEIKALWHLPWLEKNVNELALYHYLTFLASPAPMTMYQNVHKLPAGFYAKLVGEELSFHEWYNPMAVSSDYSVSDINNEAFCVERVQSLLRDSIKKRMMSDVPFGVFLSGGIDSSLNVALMSEFTDKINTFNVVFSDGLEYDERQWARKVSNKFSTNHHEIVISEEDAFNFYEKMVYHQDEPLADWVCLPLYFVSKLAKDSGVSVVQCGEGSDEIFCGYRSYTDYLDFYNKYWRPSQKWVPHSMKKVLYFAAKLALDGGKVDHIKNWVDNKNLFWSGAVAFKESLKSSLVWTPSQFHDPVVEKIYSGMKQNFDSYSIVDYHLRQLKGIGSGAHFMNSMIYLELKQRLPELLLMRLDKMAMATSIEGRVPFLDHKLVEFSLQMPSSFKYKNGIAKYILKKACEGILPNDIIYRKKIGFAAPVNKWFRNGKYFKNHFNSSLNSAYTGLNKDYLKKLLDRHQGNVDLSSQLWTIQNLISSINQM